MKQEFTYDSHSNTIRLMPQNYLVAVHRYGTHGDFIADPDAAIEDSLAVGIFLKLRNRKMMVKSMDHLLNDLNELLIMSFETYKTFQQFLSDPEEKYHDILKALQETLKTDPDEMIDNVYYPFEPNGDENRDTINVCEKFEFTLTVREFCDMACIS